MCAGRPADLICFFLLLLPYSVHLKYTRPHRRVFIYTLVVEAVRVFCCQRASLFHLDSIAHNTPPLGEAIEGGFSTEGFFWRRGGAFVVGDIVLTQRYELEKGQTLKNGRVHRETQQQRRFRCFPLFLVKDDAFQGFF